MKTILSKFSGMFAFLWLAMVALITPYMCWYDFVVRGDMVMSILDFIFIVLFYLAIAIALEVEVVVRNTVGRFGHSFKDWLMRSMYLTLGVSIVYELFGMLKIVPK